MNQSFRFFLLSIFLLSSGCSTLMGEPRSDFDDSYSRDDSTTGGVWPERRTLDEDGYAENEPYHFGHSDRSLGGEYAQDGESSRSRSRSPASMNGDGEYGYEPKPLPQKRRRTTRADFIDEAQSTGSLWASDGQTNYFFTKNRVKGVGDIVSVTLEEQMVKDISAEVKRTLTKSERENEITLAEEANAKTEETSNREPASAEKGEEKTAQTDEKKPVTYEDLDISKSIAVKSGDTMMAEIVDRYPNGNYKIMGSKNIPYRGGKRYMTFAGIVRSADINDTNDSVTSGRLYEYKLKIER